jgi:membrane protein required for colicin V production
MGGLTALDVIVLLLVGGGLTIGFLRGFVTEVLSLAAWIAAIVALKFLHAPATALLETMVGTRGGAAVFAFALIFLVIFIGTRMLARRVGGYTRSSLIGPVDRVLGAGFGALKGLIGATLLYLLANLVYDTAFGRLADRPDWMAQSRTYPLLNASGRAIVDFVEARRQAGEQKEEGDNVQADEALRNEG